MANDPTAPIVRLTPDDRVANFNAKSNSIYNKFSEHSSTSGGGLRLGFQQPYIYTHISDSNSSKYLTKYDSQAFPLGSTIRDVKRLGKFMASGTGLLFIGKQFLIQRQTAFNETRLYNPLSILAAAAQQGSTGLINKPTRYLEGGLLGGIVNFAKTAVMSSLGMKADAINSEVDGVAYEPVSTYASVGLGAKGKGLLHLDGGQKAQGRFDDYWPGHSTKTSTGKTGFLQSLGKSLLSKFMPSTMPLGFGSKSQTSLWQYRPEYQFGVRDTYQKFLDDPSGLLSVHEPMYAGKTTNSQKKSRFDLSPMPIDKYQRYFPASTGLTSKNASLYVPTRAYGEDDDAFGQVPVTINLRDQTTIKKYQIEELMNSAEKWEPLFTWGKASTERLTEVKDYNSVSKTNYLSYQKIPDRRNSKNLENIFTTKLTDPLTLDKRGFFKSQYGGTGDSYNLLEPFGGERYDGNGDAPNELRMEKDYYQSKDIIYFYFYDIVNSKYIPFRATITGINDQHSADWEEISYLGRADKLYVYKGFTREVNFNFTVYANSINELVPMWTRINYLVGLSRPSKYTSPDSTKSFMYPPMTTIRIGDMFVDQPCVIKSTGVTVPEDATWETQRGLGETYSYLQGTNIDLSKYNTGQMYQLPTKVDISINLSIMEKKKSIVDGNHYFTPFKSGIDTPVDKTQVNKLINSTNTNFVASSPTFGTDLPSFNPLTAFRPPTP